MYPMQIIEQGVVFFQIYRIAKFKEIKMLNSIADYCKTIDKLGIDAVIAKMRAEGKKV